jgi:hypothetical protein
LTMTAPARHPAKNQRQNNRASKSLHDPPRSVFIFQNPSCKTTLSLTYRRHAPPLKPLPISCHLCPFFTSPDNNEATSRVAPQPLKILNMPLDFKFCFYSSPRLGQ